MPEIIDILPQPPKNFNLDSYFPFKTFLAFGTPDLVN